jgi:hypothetical protein
MIMFDNTQLWNFQQSILAKLGRPPMDCTCEQCETGSTYECEGCKKERAYCCGQDDDFFELCDYCWDALPESVKDPTTTTENQGEPI